MKNLIPAVPTRVEPWILFALEEASPMKRSELLKRVQEMAQNEGFMVDRRVLKVALRHLASRDSVVKPQYAWWGLPKRNKKLRASANGGSK